MQPTEVEAKIYIQAAAQLMMDAVLRLMQDDPHQWSSRPCPTCRSVSSLVGKPFGCYEYQRNCGEVRA